MLHEKVFLKDFYNGIKTDAFLKTYIRDVDELIDPERRRANVIVCAGGSYALKSPREAEPVALEFLSRGYNAFLLDYTTVEEAGVNHYPKALLEASAAVAHIRKNKEKYHAKDTIIICGFSAGGHLAASLGTLWNEPMIEEALGIAEGENRPDGMILGYPVITNSEYGHLPSFENLAGENPDPELSKKLSLENSVGKHTPPAFIWHTYADGGVPMENSLLFAAAMRKADIPFELHIYPDGQHGLSLGNIETVSPKNDMINPHITSWIGLCEKWIKRFIDK